MMHPGNDSATVHDALIVTTVFTNLLFTGHEQEAQDDSDEELEVSNLQLLYLFIYISYYLLERATP